MNEPHKKLRPSGGYRKAASFKEDQTNPTDLTDLADQQRWALYARWLDDDAPAIRANATICLIHQANFLLDRQIAALEAASLWAVATPNNLPPSA